MATVTATTGGRTEQLSAVTDKGLTDFPLGKFNQLVSSTLRVPALAYESVTVTELLALTLGEFEAAEIHDLLLVTQAVTAVRTDCETLKRTAVSQDWLPTTAVPGSMTDGLYVLRHLIQSPDSPCNCFSLAALHTPRVPELASTEDRRDTVSKLQDAALFLHTGRDQLLWEL